MNNIKDYKSCYFNLFKNKQLKNRKVYDVIHLK